jgi:hypothetical protein
MTETAQPGTATNRADAVGELLTKADVDSLNSALADRGIAAEQIITILHVPAQIMVDPTPAKFRVLYRVS